MALENSTTLSFRTTSTFQAHTEPNVALINSAFPSGPEPTFSDHTSLRRTLKALDLYPFSEEDSMIAQASAAIERCLTPLEAARLLSQPDSYIAQDEHMMRARLSVLKIFEYRRLGEGFGLVSNALAWSLKNLSTDRPTPRQLNLIIDSLTRLRDEPFLHFDSAMQIIDELEEASLEVEPQSLDEVLVVDYERE